MGGKGLLRQERINRVPSCCWRTNHPNLTTGSSWQWIALCFPNRPTILEPQVEAKQLAMEAKSHWDAKLDQEMAGMPAEARAKIVGWGMKGTLNSHHHPISFQAQARNAKVSMGACLLLQPSVLNSNANCKTPRQPHRCAPHHARRHLHAVGSPPATPTTQVPTDVRDHLERWHTPTKCEPLDADAPSHHDCNLAVDWVGEDIFITFTFLSRRVQTLSTTRAGQLVGHGCIHPPMKPATAPLSTRWKRGRHAF